MYMYSGTSDKGHSLLRMQYKEPLYKGQTFLLLVTTSCTFRVFSTSEKRTPLLVCIVDLNNMECPLSEVTLCCVYTCIHMWSVLYQRSQSHRVYITLYIELHTNYIIYTMCSSHLYSTHTTSLVPRPFLFFSLIMRKGEKTAWYSLHG